MVNTSVINGRTVFRKTGSPTFYAIYNHMSDTNPLIKMGYSGGVILSIYKIIEPDLTEYPLTTYTELEAFLRTLNDERINLSEVRKEFDLDSDMQANGKISLWNTLELADFMILTRAKRPFYLDQGIKKKMSFSQPRPEISQIIDHKPELMLNLVRLGRMQRIAVRLLDQDGISFEQFSDLFKFWYKTDDPISTYGLRIQIYRQFLKNIFKIIKYRMLTQEDFDLLGIGEEPELV